VRLGSRAFDILTPPLVERPGEVVGKEQLIARACRKPSSRNRTSRSR